MTVDATMRGATPSRATLTRAQIVALLGMGVLSLLVTGVLSELLGALVDEGRLTAGGVGYAATLEAWTMAAAVGVASIAFSPRRLRLVGIVSTVVLVGANLATLEANGNGVYLVRAVAGGAEGMMLWMASSMIVRTNIPARLTALMFLALSLVQLAVSAVLGAAVLPRFGGDGGYMLVAAVSLIGIPLALASPDRLGALPGGHGESHGLPSPRGWTALLATVLFTGATQAVSVYLVPLARAAGLSAPTAHLALSAALGAQIVGSIVATLVAERVNYLAMFAVTTVGYLAVWGYYTLPASTWPFVAVTAASGFVAMFVSPFLLPMLINADRTRHAALLSPGAQLLSGGLGPLLGAWAVEGSGMNAMLAMSAAMLTLGFVIVVAIRVRHPAASA